LFNPTSGPRASVAKKPGLGRRSFDGRFTRSLHSGFNARRRGFNYSQFDFALLAAFISSITTGEKLNCDYPVTNAGLRQFENYSTALRILMPSQFERPQIACSTILNADAETNTSNKKIVTLSGGIDSTYAASSIKLKDDSYTRQ